MSHSRLDQEYARQIIRAAESQRIRELRQLAGATRPKRIAAIVTAAALALSACNAEPQAAPAPVQSDTWRAVVVLHGETTLGECMARLERFDAAPAVTYCERAE